MSGRLDALLRGAAGSGGAGSGNAGSVRKDAASARAAVDAVLDRLADLYARMESAYDACAREAGLSCAGCSTNCCTSFFRHHTHVEWLYLWRGLRALPQARRAACMARAAAYVRAAREKLAAGALPDAMCPLNEDGLCVLYAHRLMICRMHGTRTLFVLPDGRERLFPGCARFNTLPCSVLPSPGGKFPVEQTAFSPESPSGPGAGFGPGGGAAPDSLFVPEETAPSSGSVSGPGTASESPSAFCPTLDRTSFYRELAELEMGLLRAASRPLHRVNLTLAEMIELGPPGI